MTKRKQSLGAAMVAKAKITFTPTTEVDPTTQLGVLGPAPGFNAAGERVADNLDIPTDLRRAIKSTPLPVVEDMKTTPRLVINNKPLDEPRLGMNILETSLDAGTGQETGLRRYLVVSMGTKVAQLLHIPDLEHVEVEVRYINDRVARGKAHWFALPPNLGERLIAKSVQWEMHGIRYSRSLLNEALTNLGMPALPEHPAMQAAPGTVAHEKAQRRAVVKGERGPGVIDTLITLLRNGGGTIDELLAGLMTAFPDRGASMRNTIKTQLNRLPKQGKLEIKRVGDRYMAADASPDTASAKPTLYQKITGALVDPSSKEQEQGAATKVDMLAKGTIPAKNDFQQELVKQKAREEHYTKCPVGKGTKPVKSKAKGKPAAKAKHAKGRK